MSRSKIERLYSAYGCYECKYKKHGDCTKDGVCPREVRDTVIAIVAFILLVVIAKLLEIYM